MGVVAVAVAALVLGLARWNGTAPVGSDADEYQLVARQLLHLEAPVVAGVEGTKYPLGYPAVLAVLDAVGLPVVTTALLLNVVLAAAAAVLAGLAAGRARGPAAAVGAAGVVLLSRPLWDATQTTMPDVALTAAVAGTLALLSVGAGRWIGSTLLAVAATAAKSVGLLVAAAATVALLAPADGRRARAWWAPLAGGLGLTAVTAVVVGRNPEHTTGYARTFWLDDPYDAAGGDASPLDVVARLPRRIDLVLADASKAVWGDLVHGPPAWALTLALLAAGVFTLRDRARVLAASFVVLHALALAVWPFSSVRFGLPLVPLAAIGAGGAVAVTAERLRSPPRLAAAVVALATAVGVAVAVPALDREAEREAAVFRDLDVARRAAIADLPPGAVPASPDYRELATVLPRDRAVLPIPYTTDTDDLLAAATAGTHLVVLQGAYGEREAVVALLLGTHPERFELVADHPGADVYRVVP